MPKNADEFLDAGLKSLQEAVEHGNQNYGSLAQKASAQAAHIFPFIMNPAYDFLFFV
ncbi:MAG: hypothetical protein ACR65R_11945 [Methylomicrobium sp.]